MQIKSILMALAVTLGVAALSTACATQPQQSAAAPSAQPTPPPNSPASTKPTIVELHGAFEDASSWSKVTRQLQSEGFSVIAPAVQLRGVASDTAALEGVISAIQGPKILVGHSYGGLLVSELASRTPDVTALVYVAAFIPQAGDTAGQLNSQFAGSLLGPATTHMVSSPDGAEMYVNTASFQELFAAGSAAQIRKYAIVATEDKAIPPAAERFEAQRAGAVITDVRSPHAVPMTNPQAVVDVIHQAAGA
jgi:pimeloyl-ACP methyl ester carboxylesterase